MSAINVNLSPCAYWCRVWRIADPPQSIHDDGCPGTPVLVHLSLEPWRTVEMTVQLGECWDAHRNAVQPVVPRACAPDGAHHAHCPARPVEVVCSISGKDWPSSEVKDAWPKKNDGYLCSTGEAFPTLEAACRASWDGVKGLVLGQRQFLTSDAIKALEAKRDAVFAKVAKVVRLEEAMLEAQQDLVASVDSPRLTASASDPAVRPSALALGVWVGKLIEQVGGMP